ncbi:MAG TPA: TonB C-terminal domain-containing protein [Candidatus Babeliales bacterium]|nr:TonB C-terminal domain-containing protein [Candidatus Babeliales bacterium]
MWHSLPRKLSRKTIFFYQLFLFVIVLHALLFLSTAFFFGGPKTLGNIFVHSQLLNQKIEFVVLPYARRVSARALNKAIQKKVATLPKHAPVKKMQKPKPKPKPKPKIVQQVKKVVPKKVEAKPAAPVKPKQPEKKAIEAKPVPEKVVEKVEEKKVDEPIYIGKEDLQALQIHDEISQSLQQHWSPPQGIRPTQACKIKVVLNEVGKIKVLTVEQSSSVLAYDMAAQMALTQTEFPKKAWNNEFTLNF